MRNAKEAPGPFGERLAGDFLTGRRGFRILARNWRSPRERHEIDLICADGEVLVFVEVKARAEGALVPGFFAVDRRKRSAVRRAAAAYLRSLASPPRTFRFDVVEVTLAREGAGRAPEILHFENIPLFSKYFTGRR